MNLIVFTLISHILQFFTMLINLLFLQFYLKVTFIPIFIYFTNLRIIFIIILKFDP